MERASHRHGDVSLSREHFRNRFLASNDWNEVASGQPPLIHVGLDRLDETGQSDWVVFILVGFYKGDESFELFTFRRTNV